MPEARRREEFLDRGDLARFIAGGPDALAFGRRQVPAVKAVQDRETAKRFQARVRQGRMGTGTERIERKPFPRQNARQWIAAGEREHRDFQAGQRFVAHRLSPFLPETPAPSATLIKKIGASARRDRGRSLRSRHRIVSGRLQG
ncbi:MAG: hypothetical protein IIZ38_10525 [Sphingomonas sp.]|uniref:hypothetical protein n=1 Tax=Sphingomonas sp. TaxID=28214 RepID=UPI0025F8B2FA|nr:hypothetical protein [Sphingomonas sp.]MBQ1498739.1 hypothetical protein [Sphingomonas sp.]